MTATFTNTAHHATARPVVWGVVARVTAAVAAARTRARTRHEYRRLLERDDIMRDVGVTPDEVRRALIENGGRR